MLERDLQNNVIKLCTTQGQLVYHTYDSRRSQAGFPDLVIVGSKGLIYRELKSDKGRLSPEQVFWLECLVTAGADAAVWRPADWPERIQVETAALGRVTAARPIPSQDEVRAFLQRKARRTESGTN